MTSEINKTSEVFLHGFYTAIEVVLQGDSIIQA